MSNYKLFCGDSLGVLKTFPDRIFHTVVTSPPYWGLRDYGTAEWEGGDAACDHKTGQHRMSDKTTIGRSHGGKGDVLLDAASRVQVQTPYRDTCGKCGATRKDQQLGLERTPEEYVDKLVAIFREVRRTLRDDGTLWLNLGDSYAANRGYQVSDTKHKSHDFGKSNALQIPPGLKPKDLVGIPWRVAFALQADGWYLRSDIIWEKPNAMPESVRDRPTKSHEYLFLLTKRETYFYDADAVREPWADNRQGRDGSKLKSERNRGGRTDGFTKPNGIDPSANGGRNRRSVWSIPTRPYKEAHFATFPPGLVEPCILAGTSEHGACSTCGTPWKRLTKVHREPDPTAGKHALRGAGHFRESPGGPANREGREFERIVESTTVGWEPTCVCSGSFVRETYQDGTFQDEEGNEYPVMKARRTYVPRIPLEDHPVKSCLVLDPFAGASTTGAVSIKHGRRFVGIELNPDYITLSERRLEEVEDSLAETQESQESA